MASDQITHRRAFRRTDDYTLGTPKVKLVHEALPLPLSPTSVLIRVRAVSLNYRDANIAHGGNPWPVIPNGILCNDAAGEVIGVGEKVKNLAIGDRVAPITDTEYISERSLRRSWLAADQDGVLADYLIFDEEKICKLPTYLDWASAAIIPCAGVTAWSSLKGMSIGQTVLIQGTGGVSSFALKLARAAGLRVIITSSSDDKLEKMKKKFPNPPLLTINYTKKQAWHEEVLELTGGTGVDIVVENGGTSSLINSIKCTRRGGTISQVGYLGKQDPSDLADLVPLIIDRRVVLRGINCGSKYDMEDLCAALSATKMPLNDIIDSTYPFEKAEESIQHLWEGRQVGKLVLHIQ
ncbi:uncharacterized protein F4807DRAFT_446363 [Annulohypoxylon truncatum]|uniref:uncharacterized protein n=1 Tax=Annulohypoxylon truncatum TaxID=327061 RepID=UPI002007E249|nr:uncharacterized protein F4807DRAFT_446363 [Annulohypoxylon truncatum]KAI1204692.1 hypothetical protein F4807DRAFT_446363 [Annulohypoxylon truncatum]